jgi:hypothetical protein
MMTGVRSPSSVVPPALLLRPRIGGGGGQARPQRVPTFRQFVLARVQQRFARIAGLGGRGARKHVGAKGTGGRRQLRRRRIPGRCPLRSLAADRSREVRLEDPRLEVEPQVPTIVVIASGLERQKRVTTYMNKPFNLVELIDTVHQRC